jgi:hypothetical protein
MWEKACLYKPMIPKIVNGAHLTPLKDLDMEAGFMRIAFTFMVGSNLTPQMCQQNHLSGFL